MNVFVRKEVRSLLPDFILAIVLAFTALAFSPISRYHDIPNLLGFVPAVLCPAMVIRLGLNCFGCEFSAGTFSQLLAQPASRQRIWRIKTNVLAIAFFIIWLVWVIAFSFNDVPRPDRYDAIVHATMFALAFYTGGLWTVLLLRQVAAAFWFTILVPIMLYVIVKGVLRDQPDNRILYAQMITLLGYSIAGYFFARRLFLRAQDTQWTGGNLTLPEMRGFSLWRSASRSHRKWRPRFALIGKEFQLHQSQFVIAGVLALLHLGVILWRHFATGLAQHPDLEFILKAVWGLWLLMPLLIGCAAVAEERKLGTLESQFCLPVKRGTQFIVKLSVVLFLAVFLGFVMPLIFEGTRILPDFGLHFDFEVKFVNTIIDWLPFIFLPGVCLGIAALSFYASTLVRNTLQAIGPAIFIILGSLSVLSNVTRVADLIYYPLWRGPLIYLIGVPVLILTLAGLTFWNFKWLAPGAKVWRRNTLVLLASLVLVATATTATWHRVWERFMPFEPAHGQARLTRQDPVVLSHGAEAVFARLPDTRLWCNFLREYSGGDDGHVLDHPGSYSGGFFVNGSNWMTAEQDWVTRQMVGLKTDGSLWVSEKPLDPIDSTNSSLVVVPEKMVQFGTETDWKSMVNFGRSELLLKNDGTLWRWGTTNFDFQHQKWPGLQAYTPYRLGNETNWADTFSVDYTKYFRKTDGSVWSIVPTAWLKTNDDTPHIQMESSWALLRTTNNESIHPAASAAVHFFDGFVYRLGIFADGTFRICDEEQRDDHGGVFPWTPADVQIGNETNWSSVVCNWDEAVTLKKDGTLWLWTIRINNGSNRDVHRDERSIIHIVPARLGTHSDWVAITDEPGGVLSLAADGTLWFWPLKSGLFYSSGNSPLPPLLETSPRPQKLASIFDTK